MEGRPYPGGLDAGLYRLDVDNDLPFREQLSFDPASRTITVRDDVCHDGMKVELYFQPVVHTALPE